MNRVKFTVDLIDDNIVMITQEDKLLQMFYARTSRNTIAFDRLREDIEEEASILCRGISELILELNSLLKSE